MKMAMLIVIVENPALTVPAAENPFYKERMQESIGFNFQSHEFCDGCEEYFYEQQDMWWWQVAEDYHDLLYEIHQTIEMLSK